MLHRNRFVFAVLAILSLPFLFSFYLLHGCSNDSTVEPQETYETFDAVMNEAGAWENPVVTGEVRSIPSLEEVVTDPEDGSTWSCTSTHVSFEDDPDEFLLFRRSADIYPGALLQGATLENDPPTRVRVDRGGGTVSILLWTGETEEPTLVVVDEVTPAKINEAINTIIGDRGDPPPAQFSFEGKAVESNEQMQMEMGLRVETFLSEIESNLSFSCQCNYRYYLVKLIQPFYTISFDPPNDYEDWFAPDVTPNDLAKDVGPGNPPVYIRSVTYGRIVYIRIQSTSSVEAIEASLEASYLGAINGSISTEYVSSLNHVDIQAAVYGGQISLGELTGSFEDLTAALNEEQSMQTALPLSYTLEDLKTGAAVKVKLATEYDVQDCRPLAAGLSTPILKWDSTERKEETLHTYYWYRWRYTHNEPYTDVHVREVNYYSNHILIKQWPDLEGAFPLTRPEESEHGPHPAPFGVNGDEGVEFCCIDWDNGGNNFKWLSDGHMFYQGRAFEDKNYTIFVVMDTPSSMTTVRIYHDHDPDDEDSIPNSPGLLFYPEEVESPAAGLRPGLVIGYVDGKLIWNHNGDSSREDLGIEPDSMPRVYAFRYDQAAGGSFFRDGTLLLDDIPLAALNNQADVFLGAHPHPVIALAEDNCSVIRVRLIEAYEGAVQDSGIEERSAAIRLELDF